MATPLPIKEGIEAIGFYQQYGGWAIAGTLVLLALGAYAKVIIPVVKWWKKEREMLAIKFEEKDQKIIELTEDGIKAKNQLATYVRKQADQTKAIADTLRSRGIQIRKVQVPDDKTIIFDDNNK